MWGVRALRHQPWLRRGVIFGTMMHLVSPQAETLAAVATSCQTGPSFEAQVAGLAGSLAPLRSWRHRGAHLWAQLLAAYGPFRCGAPDCVGADGSCCGFECAVGASSHGFGRRQRAFHPGPPLSQRRRSFDDGQRRPHFWSGVPTAP